MTHNLPREGRDALTGEVMEESAMFLQ